MHLITCTQYSYLQLFSILINNRTLMQCALHSDILGEVCNGAHSAYIKYLDFKIQITYLLCHSLILNCLINHIHSWRHHYCFTKRNNGLRCIYGNFCIPRIKYQYVYCSYWHVTSSSAISTFDWKEENSLSQEIPFILLKLRVRYCIPKSQTHPVCHNVTHLTLFPHMPMSSQRSLSFRFFHHNSVYISVFFPWMPHASPSHLP